MTCYLNGLKRQEGAALVVAMLIVSLVTIFTASVAIESNFNTKRVTNQFAMQQAYSYLRATEAFAHKALSFDMQQDIDNGALNDHLEEIWAQEAPPFVLDEGAYAGKIEDLQARFNLNSLRTDAGIDLQSRPAVPFTKEQGMFIRLLQSFNDDEFYIDQSEAVAITEAVVDWLDGDQSAIGFNCGEDDAYYGIDGRMPHRTGDTPFVSVSELLLICNMRADLYERLKFHVTVWPSEGPFFINLNTATPNVLRSILVREVDFNNVNKPAGKNFIVPTVLEEREVQAVLDIQPTGGFKDYDGFLGFAGGLTFWPNDGKSPNVSLNSQYFLLSASVIYGPYTQTMESVLFRSEQGGTISYIARSIGAL